MALSVHRKIAVGCRDRRWRSRRTWFSCIAALLTIALAGCVAAVPTEAEVLDDPSFADRREAASAQARSMGEDLMVASHLVKVGSRSFVLCVQGINDMKHKDGFGLKCDAVSTIYLAWHGNFEAGASQLEKAQADRCPVAQARQIADPPSGLSVAYASRYRCANGVIVSASFADAHSPGGETGYLDSPCQAPNVRCGDQLTPNEISSRARSFDWVARLDITQNVYTEVVK